MIDYRGLEREEAVYRDIAARCAIYVARLDPAGAELHSAFVGVLFGGVLLSLDHTFSRSPAYGQLASVAPEWLWGLVWLTVGLAQFAGVLLDGATFGRFGWLHQAATFVMTVLWVYWCWSLWASTGVTTATTTYAVVAAGSGWGWLRAGR